MGLNCSDYDILSFWIEGGSGGETPNIYLSDGMVERFINIENYVTVTTSWQKVDVLLEDFSAQGVDISRLSSLEVRFEEGNGNGTVYLDDISITHTYSPPAPVQQGKTWWSWWWAYLLGASLVVFVVAAFVLGRRIAKR